MKTLRFVVVLMGLMASCPMVMAQAEIDRVADELEQKGVELGKVITRNPKTKKIVKMVKTYEFRSKDGKYAEKLKQAFAKEAENSTKEISEKGGREWTLIFDTDDSHMVYTLQIDSQKPDPKVELSIVVSHGKQKSVRVFSPNFGEFDMDDFNEKMNEFNDKMNQFYFDMDSFKVGKFFRETERLRKIAES